MLQHSELPGDCGVPVGHGGHDHAAHPAQGHCPLQPDGQRCECSHSCRHRNICPGTVALG